MENFSEVFEKTRNEAVSAANTVHREKVHRRQKGRNEMDGVSGSAVHFEKNSLQ
jgi:dihydroorotate dehydrogenase